MRIGIDARYLSHGLMGGINSFLKNLLPVLFKVGCDDIFTLYVDSKRPFELVEVPVNVVVKVLPYRNELSSLQHDLFMKRSMSADHLDVVHFPANYGFAPRNVRSVITLHDEINIMPLDRILFGHRKNLKTMGMMTYLHFCSSAAVRKADLVITISGYARDQILQWSVLPAENVVKIFHGKPTDAFKVSDERELNRVRDLFGLKKGFILADALKNPGVLVRAWKNLPEDIRQVLEIVFYSRYEAVRPEVHQAVEAGYAKFLVRPSRQNLIALYSMACVFVFPSWIEGFGIPILEAMACGAPVIASDRGSIPEVVGNAGLIMDAEDDGTLTRYLEHLYRNRDERENLIGLGFERAAQFSWEESARQYLRAYQIALETPRP